MNGLELGLRYIPFPFKGAKVQFYGVGLKQELNQYLKRLPLQIAIGGAYQNFSIGEVLKSDNFCGTLLLGKRISFLEPIIGISYEQTKVKFSYDFSYKILGKDEEGNIVEKDTTEKIRLSYKGDNEWRAFGGLNLNLGFFFLHLSYNVAEYQVLLVSGGVRFR